MPACLCLFRTCVRSSPGRCRRRRKRESPTRSPLRRAAPPPTLWSLSYSLGARAPPRSQKGGSMPWQPEAVVVSFCCLKCAVRLCAFIAHQTRVIKLLLCFECCGLLACPVVLVCCLLLAPCAFARGCLSVVKFTQPHPHRSFGKRPPSPKGHLLLAYLGLWDAPRALRPPRSERKFRVLLTAPRGKKNQKKFALRAK